MLGSPNYVRFVYDGDGSDTPDAGPPGSDAIESVFTDYFAVPGPGVGADSVRRSLRLRRVHRRSASRPAVCSAAPRASRRRRRRRPTAAPPACAYDPCYHQACDTITNLNTQALNELGDAAAHATLTLAMSKTGLFPDGSRHQAAATKQSTPRHEKIASR